MPLRPDTYAAQLELLAAGGELVSANARQARELTRWHGLSERAAGRAVWSTPRILSWRAWLEREFRALPERAALIDDVVAAAAWQRVVASSRAGQGLLSARGVAVAAARSWTLAHDFRVDLARLEPVSGEQAAFSGWAREFAELGRHEQWLDAAALAAALAEAHGRADGTAALGRDPGPGLIGFHGFDGLTPARARLVAALAATGHRVRELDLERPGSQRSRVAHHTAASPEAELDAIAAWLVARLARDPGARLAVIIPDLASRWRSVARLLDDRLQPAVLAPGAGEERPYTLVTGPRLGDAGIVDGALLLLALGGESLELALAGRVLRSPYLVGSEADGRARLDAKLRERGAAQLTPEALRRLAASEAGACPELARTITAVRGELAGAPQRSFADWSAAMLRALRAAGWARGRELSTGEYQAARGFEELLTELAGLARVRAPVQYMDARDELAALAVGRALQPEPGDAPIVVLDSHQAPGITFDGLWVAGLSDDAFPAAAAPDPFLPLPVQQSRAMPAADAAATLAAARRALAGWLRCTDELVLSHARRVEEVDRQASRLLPSAVDFQPAEPLRARAHELLAGARLVASEDRTLPALPPGAPLSGGARLLELQSLCPFRAAATLRLGARALERSSLGIAPRRRGERLHAALAAFWQLVGSHDALVALGAAGRVRAVHTAVREAMSGRDPAGLAPRLLELEADWMRRALGALAELELARAPFTVVGTEASLVADFGGHALALRIDRLDRLEDGGLVVIDYKSGRRTPRDWFGPRPDQPQLPLYAAQLPEPPAAVALALLTLGATAFRGLAERSGILPGVGPPPVSATAAGSATGLGPVVAAWRSVMQSLVAQFVAGVAGVDPTPAACEHCELAILCRIELRPEPGEDGEATDGGARAGGGQR